MPLKPSPRSAVSLSVKSILVCRACDMVKYLFLLSVWAWFLTAGGELINNVIKTRSPHALSPSPSSGEWLYALNCPGFTRPLDAFSLLITLSDIVWQKGYEFFLLFPQLFAKGNIHWSCAPVQESMRVYYCVLPGVRGLLWLHLSSSNPG